MPSTPKPFSADTSPDPSQATEGLTTSVHDAGATGLGSELERARAELAQLRRIEKEQQDTNQELKRAAHSLGERVKELACLYSISEIAARTELGLDEALRLILEVIPPAWQYPEITCSSIALEGHVYRSANYAPSEYRQTQPIRVGAVEVGLVEVLYREARPEESEGPFLREERNLINAIAQGIGNLVQRRRSQEALDAENAKNRALLAAIPDLIFQVDAEGRLLGWHSGDYQGLAPVAEPLLNRPLLEAVDQQTLPRRTIELGLGYVKQVLTSGQAHSFLQHAYLSGKEHDFEVRLVRATETSVLGMIRDVTEKRRLEREILEISGREQRRIGRDLHDGLCQHLAGIGFMAKALASRIPEHLAGNAREIVRQVEETLAQTRRIARGLNPVRLETDGLPAILQDLAEQTASVFGLPCTFEHTGGPPAPDLTAAIHLYRIAQEAVGNAIKHSHAARLAIHLDVSPAHTTLSITDDGIGIREGGNGMGMGFNIMKYRALIVGGALSIRRGHSGGTVVECSVPAPVAL